MNDRLSLNHPAAKVREAFIYSFPVHDLAQSRWEYSQKTAHPQYTPPNVLRHNRALLDHRARTVTTPNNDTLYSSAWLDLADGAMLLSLPDMHDRYFSFAFLDIFTNNVACIGRRTTGTAAQTWLLAGPGWHGTVPHGAEVIRLSCNDVWMLGRLLVDGEEDLGNVHAIQDAITLRPLDSTGVPRLLQSVPQESSPEHYLDLVNEVLGRNPLPPHESELLESFEAVGIRPGQKGAWHMLDPDVRDAWSSTHQANLASLTVPPPGTRHTAGGSWTGGPDHLGRFGADYACRAFVSMVGLGALEREEAIYLTTQTDEAGMPLHGSHAYRLTLPGNVPVDAFWSLSMYEITPDGRRFFTENTLGRYALGDRTPGLRRQADGSLEVLLQHARPQGGEANWLPAPAGPFSLTVRFYQPRKDLLDRSFLMPDAVRLR